MFVLLVGIKLARKRAGTETIGMSLLAPPSMTWIESAGSASASLAATTQPVVPPGVRGVSYYYYYFKVKVLMGGAQTASNDYIYLVQVIRQCSVYRHCKYRMK